MANAIFNNSCFMRVYGQQEVASEKMQTRIKLWFDLYFDDLEQNSKKPIDSLERIPYIIVDEITKTVFTEYDAGFKTETKKEQLLSLPLEQLTEIKEEALKLAQIGGECLLKPIPNNQTGSFDVTVISRLNYAVLATDLRGNITALGLAEYFEHGNSYFTVLERRSVDVDGYLTIETKLFCSTDRELLGNEEPLTNYLEYEAVPPRITYDIPIYSVGLVRVRMKKANCIDNSKMPVSIYAVAESAIYRLYRQEHLYDCEFELGQSRVIASKDYIDDAVGAMRGHGEITDNIFLPVDDAPGNVGITVYNPQLRASEYELRKTGLCRTIENQIGLRSGMLANVEYAEKTATEVDTNKNRFNATVEELSHIWLQSVILFLRTCDLSGRIFFPASWGSLGYEEPTISFGDGVLYDRAKVWVEYVQMVMNGWLKPELALAWYFNLPHETEEDLQKIRAEYMPVVRGFTFGTAPPDFAETGAQKNADTAAN